MTRHRLALLMSALLATAAIAVTGCSDDDDSGASETAAKGPAFKETVNVTGTGYHPRRARILVGGSITWINRDPTRPHTAETAPGSYKDLPGGEDQSFDTHTLSWGEPYTVTFHKPGSYSYGSSYDGGSEWEGQVDVIEKIPPR